MNYRVLFQLPIEQSILFDCPPEVAFTYCMSVRLCGIPGPAHYPAHPVCGIYELKDTSFSFLLPGVIFNSSLGHRRIRSAHHKLPPHVTYTIRTNVLYSMRTDMIKNPSWKFHPQSLPADGFKYNYIFVPLQDIIERAIIAVQTGQEALEPTTQAQAAPYPCHTSDLWVAVISQPFLQCLLPKRNSALRKQNKEKNLWVSVLPFQSTILKCPFLLLISQDSFFKKKTHLNYLGRMQWLSYTQSSVWTDSTHRMKVFEQKIPESSPSKTWISFVPWAILNPCEWSDM